MPVDIAPEICVAILEYVPRRSLLITRTVSSAFYRLSSTLLYREFYYRSSTYVLANQGVPEGTDSLVGREMERLAFWSSDKVCSHVRTAYVSHSGFIMKYYPALGNAVFHTISRFANLGVLSCDFNGYRMELPALQLASMTHLQELYVHGGLLCRPMEPTPFKLNLHHFSYTNVSLLIMGDGPQASSRSYLSMLNPETLCSLELATGDDHEITLRGCHCPSCTDARRHRAGLGEFVLDRITMASFYNLRTLSISFAWTNFADVHATISPFPSIENLILDITGSCLGQNIVPPTPMASLLRCYNGPAILLPLILHGSQLVQLAVKEGTIAEVLRTLHLTTYSANSITASAIRVTLADVRQSLALMALLALLPSLTRLALHVSSDKIEAGGSTLYEPLNPAVRTPSLLTPLLVSIEGIAFHPQRVCDQLVYILTVPPALHSVIFRWRLVQRDAEIIELPDFESRLTSRLREVNSGARVTFSKRSGGPFGLSE
ncbi:hypothetical protein B0H19DRAFT_1275225 [Mycena capillaripes]|nr:hypothetical protein B0H19DRAFT_1275225 [Mycena capillaripes]